MRRLVPAVVAALSIILTSAACDTSRGPRAENPNYREPMVIGYIWNTEIEDGSIEYDKNVDVYDNDGMRMIPVVTLNEKPVEIYGYGPTVYSYGDNYYNPVNQKYELKVTHYWGDAFSRVVLPGDFRITTPPDTYKLKLESTLVVTWQSSASAQWYWVSLYAAYDFYDTLLQWDDYEFYLDTLVYDTVIAVPPSRVFPGFVESLIEGDGSAMIWAGNGSTTEPGDVGNVRGAGFGYFWAINEPMYVDFYVNAPPVARRVPGVDERRAKLLALLRQRVPVPQP